MSIRRVLLAASILLLTSRISHADVFNVNPAGAFLHTNGETPPNPLIIDLSTLNFTVTPGVTVLHLQRLGLFNPNPPGPEDSSSLMGVFSSSNAITATTNLNRVTGAIDAGVDFVTSPTFVGSQPTDIPQDFLIDSGGPFTVVTPAFSFVDVQVPLGAQFLFISTYDSNYSTNTDTNADFQISVTPEPGCLALLALGSVGLLGRRMRSRR